MNKLRIGVMGTASIARRLVVPAIKLLTKEFDIVAVASRTADKAKEFAALFNIEAIVGYANLVDRSDIDVIYMPLPTGLHHEWILKCLNSGKHVLAEKSLAMNMDSASVLVNCAKERNLLLMENFMFQYHGQHGLTWELLNKGEIGEMRLFRSQFGFPPLDEDNFRYDLVLGGGALLDAGAYTIKASQWFLNSPLEVKAATLYIDGSCGIDRYGHATLSDKQGRVAQISFGFDNYYQCNYEVWGSAGNIYAERAFTPKPNECPAIVVSKQGRRESIEMPMDNHFVNLLKVFHSAILKKDYSNHRDDIIRQSMVITEIQNTADRISI